MTSMVSVLARRVLAAALATLLVAATLPAISVTTQVTRQITVAATGYRVLAPLTLK
jgi:hypothetical protein